MEKEADSDRRAHDDGPRGTQEKDPRSDLQATHLERVGRRRAADKIEDRMLIGH
jgi:hypothetical protein